jgi:hypothetical protein
VRSPRRSAAALLLFPAAPAADGKKPNMGDEPHDPLAVLLVPPTAQQVIEHIFEEIEHAISVARSAGDLAAAAQLLARAQAAAERILAEQDGTPRILPQPGDG